MYGKKLETYFFPGLQQSFVIEIWDFHSQHVIRNLTNHRPVFNVPRLEQGASYIVRIYAVNSKGRSEVQVLQASTLKAAEKQTGINAGRRSSHSFPIFHIPPLYLSNHSSVVNAPAQNRKMRGVKSIILIAIVNGESNE